MSVLTLTGLYVILSIPVKLLLLLLSYPFVGGFGRKYKHHLGHSLRLLLCRTGLMVPVRDCAYICIYSNEVLLKTIIKILHRNYLNKEKLNDYGKRYDENSFWIVKQPDIKKNDPIIVYLHGGGYYFETMPSQIESLLAVQKLLDPSLRSKVSILLLDYKLACRGYTMPNQLNELHQTYKRLAFEEGYTNISFIGDSAGGNLAVTYLQYLKLVNEKTPIVYPNKVVLISPWVKVAIEEHQYAPGNSMYDNDPIDMIQYRAFHDVDRAKAIVGPSNVHSLLISPGNTPYKHDDWTSIPTLSSPTSDILVLVGEDEVFRDDVLTWAKYALGVPLYGKYKYGDSEGKNLNKLTYIRKSDEKSAGIRFYIEPWGVHDSTLFFESHLLRKLTKNPKLTIDALDQDEFFGITRIVKFLNETLT
ncbi:membrane protein [Scheffersomyces coipomensis]|uniref:uncharacterized protein n=1 Tax=Scheffersomyces coipomensis TaxID=1788519 RepID=UPI00315CFA2D